MAEKEKIKVLICDDEGQLSRHLANFLEQHGFAVKQAQNGAQARSLTLEFRPRFVLCDLMLPEMNAIELIKYISTERDLRHNFIKVLVMSRHNDESNVRQAFRAGASDYIIKPIQPDSLLKRLVFHCRKTRHIREIDKQELKKVDEASLMLHLTDLVLRQALSGRSAEDVLYNLTRMVSMKVEGIRCSIVNYIDPHTGLIVTSSDNRQISGRKIDLEKYPEILQAVNSGRVVAIENLEEDEQMSKIRGRLKEINFNSLVVCPVERLGQIFGVLSLRMPKEKVAISDNEIRFVEIVSHVVSLVLSNQDFSKIPEFWKKSA